jgi:hypothetical protein
MPIRSEAYITSREGDARVRHDMCTRSNEEIMYYRMGKFFSSDALCLTCSSIANSFFFLRSLDNRA